MDISYGKGRVTQANRDSEGEAGARGGLSQGAGTGHGDPAGFRDRCGQTIILCFVERECPSWRAHLGLRVDADGWGRTTRSGSQVFRGLRALR